MSWVRNFMSRQYAKPTGLFGRLITAPLLNRSNKLANQLVFDTVAEGDPGRIAEIGFGGGELLLRLAGTYPNKEIHGVEISSEMLIDMRIRSARLGINNLTLGRGGVDNLPFGSGSFDCVCTVNTVYFWSDLDAGLRELHRVLLPGGRAIIGMGSASHLRDRGFHERGFTLYSPDELHAAMQANGFNTDPLRQVERAERGPFYACVGIRAA
ncbi:MAG: class I SAM-dependent methyltransferase [Pseudomonadota bacterium]